MHERTALVLETNNLRGGGADAARVSRSLTRVLEHLKPQIERLREVVITHDGLPASLQPAGENVRYVRIPPGTDYYQAKNLGFDATRAEIVVFGDSDCRPDAGWLERLIAPFSDPAVSVVSGRTTYRDDVFGQAASAIDFLYFETAGDHRATKNFYANNVAFRRELFAEHRFQPLPDTYRGHCQVLGMRLFERGIPIHFVPEARTVHRFPDTLRELATLRLLRGADTVSVAPHIARTYLPGIEPLARRHPTAAALATLGARFGTSLAAIGRQDMRDLSKPRKLGCVASVVAISLVDGAGVLRRGGDSQRTLSYHR